jgi:gamma-glutamylcyclotransferase (GGCT)/AIG2-like uncharacterized protein YtfP
MTKILAYGTLKKGNGLHPYLKGSKFIRTGIIKGYKMYCNGYYPMIIKTDDEKDTITGEIYDVADTGILNTLDMIEGSYTRTKEKALLSNGKEIEVEVYVYNYGTFSENWRKVMSGVWDN